MATEPRMELVPDSRRNARQMVELDNVTVVFPTPHGPLTALQGLSFQVQNGEFVALIGPSGCGKSTVLRLIADIYQPTQGTVRVAGQPAADARRESLVNLMFQEPVLLPWLTVYQNVKMALDLTQPPDHPDPFWLLEFVGLKGREHDYPHQLSGGMQQRVALARALVTNPQILLMDEPFAALDELTRERMGNWLLSIWDETQKTVLFVTHSIPEALYLSDRVIVLDIHPGRVRTAMEVDLPRPRGEAVKESLAFFEQLGVLRTHLRSVEHLGEVDGG